MTRFLDALVVLVPCAMLLVVACARDLLHRRQTRMPDRWLGWFVERRWR